MNNANNSNQEIYALLAELARKQIQTQEQLEETQYKVQELTSEVTRVLARSAVLDNVLLELRDSHETMQGNFNEDQRTTNAALNSLEAINLKLIEIITRDLN